MYKQRTVELLMPLFPLQIFKRVNTHIDQIILVETVVTRTLLYQIIKLTGVFINSRSYFGGKPQHKNIVNVIKGYVHV